MSRSTWPGQHLAPLTSCASQGLLVVLQGHGVSGFDKPMPGVAGSDRKVRAEPRSWLRSHPNGILARPLKLGWSPEIRQIHRIVRTDRHSAASRRHTIGRMRSRNVEPGRTPRVRADVPTSGIPSGASFIARKSRGMIHPPRPTHPPPTNRLTSSTSTKIIKHPSSNSPA
jgi:hypothetical protein